MESLSLINQILGALFLLCYLYQFLYIPLFFILKNRRRHPEPHRLAVLICARNEQEVIQDLIHSIRRQTYPLDKVHVFVMADNCTDDTAGRALYSLSDPCLRKDASPLFPGGDVFTGKENLPAPPVRGTVYTRFNTEDVGKGYALRSLMREIRHDYGDVFDAYLVFDADNVLDEGYLSAMEKTFSEGHEIITSYRNSKNYGVNWISAGYALWFLRESRFLNQVRYMLGTSCAVSGTGFLFSRNVAREMGSWPFHMLTEDIQFSVHEITNGRKIAFCPEAKLYDEQPVTFRQSFRQRLRWSKGYLQVFGGYGTKLLGGMLRGSFSCFDMAMTIMPAFVLSTLMVINSLAMGILSAVTGGGLMAALQALGMVFVHMYLVLFVIGLITTMTEWKEIGTTPAKKIGYMFTFPIFMATYLPISLTALFSKVQWKPIEHTYSMKRLQKESSL